MMAPIVLFMVAWGGLAAAHCLPVDAEWITVRDVVERVHQFSGLDPDLRLVRAPFPGARRVVGPAALPAVEGEMTPFCVERRLRMLPRERVVEALRATLSTQVEAAIEFEIVDFDHSMVPSGRLEFLRQSLPPLILGKADDPVLWRGKVFYAEGRSLPVWARVRLWVEGEACLLKREVARGESLSPEDCKLAKTRFSPFSVVPLHDPRALERTVAARRLGAGEPLYPTLVVHRPEVEAGKPVDLRVVNGGAQLRFQARATSSGSRGASVSVTNPSNGKRLDGHVVGQGAVEVRLK